MLDSKAASIAELELGEGEGAESAMAVEAECILQVSVSKVSRAASVVGNGDLFPRVDVSRCVDSLDLRVAVPVIVSVGETAVVDEANGRVDTTDRGVGTAGQSVGSDNAAKWLLTGKIIVKGEELPLLGL